MNQKKYICYKFLESTVKHLAHPIWIWVIRSHSWFAPNMMKLRRTRHGKNHHDTIYQQHATAFVLDSASNESGDAQRRPSWRKIQFWLITTSKPFRACFESFGENENAVTVLVKSEISRPSAAVECFSSFAVKPTEETSSRNMQPATLEDDSDILEWILKYPEGNFVALLHSMFPIQVKDSMVWIISHLMFYSIITLIHVLSENLKNLKHDC